MILETSFLIDLERELRRSEAGPASAFLEHHPKTRLDTTFAVAGELAAGVSTSRRREWVEFLRPYHVIQSSPRVAWEYGEAYRYLASHGMLIGANDLWIAAAALAHEVPLVTRDDHYRRVPRLAVIDYRS